MCEPSTASSERRRWCAGSSGTEIVLDPLAGGIDRVMGEIVASFATMLAEGDPTRIKFCANPDCGWVMYDSSRNRTRRWCDKECCGNLIKVRRHRRKQRESLR
jgi:predicted RNA-binding Zn ribbon-like protein